MIPLDIHSAITTATVLAGLGAVISILIGRRLIKAGKRLPFFRKRSQLIARGFRSYLAAVLLVAFGVALNTLAEPVIYKVYPPTPTVTATPTVTLTPTISLTPTITLSPTITETPSVTNTPFMPEQVASGFTGQVTPPPDAIFSPLVFGQKLNDSFQPVNPAVEFENPVGHLYGVFSFDKMLSDVQWSALWYRGNELVYYESIPWNGGSGGYGYTDWEPSPDQWLPGEYEVRIFVGMEFKVAGRFTVTGEAPAAQPSAPPSATPSLTATRGTPGAPTLPPQPTPTLTRTQPRLPTPTPTPQITPTRYMSPTPPGGARPTPTK